ncbi:receptor-type tyrosine-protein phosphatase delta-like isoform X2 [Pomacea canaliculata]|uniref:receptor-type tyrosine-protein phosphatase delta-like isoform X2 n=1 Tax=Pomacea canaliculata TaxID=400727 RepID=UPI000D73BC3D|nr:receptor-type tyrosine-protein phosphatase delta-like isoform X2 [Pomacea canaliculata]
MLVPRADHFRRHPVQAEVGTTQDESHQCGCVFCQFVQDLSASCSHLLPVSTAHQPVTMVRWFRQTGLGTMTAAVTAKMVVTAMMVMLHCVLIHSASTDDLATLPADSSSRDASSLQKVSDVHSTGAQYGTEVTKSDEHSRSSDALTSQSDVPNFVITRGNKKGQGKVSRKRSTYARVTPVRTTKVRRGTQQGESTQINTQTTRSAELMLASQHLTDDMSTVLTTTEMSTTSTTTTRRPLVLGDTCRSPSDCQKNINRSTCASGVCVCAEGYFKIETRCYAEPRNLRVTQRNDSVNISWEGDNIEYTVYINISNKYNTTFKMLNVTGTQVDFSPIHPGSGIKAVVSVWGSNSSTGTANATIAPSSPQRLNITFVNDTCMEAEWSPGTGVTEQYRVYVMYLDRRTRHVTTQTTWTYCGLSPGEQFNVSVYAMSNSVLSRVPASTSDYTTPSKPRDGRLQNTGLTNTWRVDIWWSSGSNKDKEFVVTVENRTDINPSVVTPSGPRYTSRIHISYGSRFTISIQAVKHGKKSSPLQITECTAPGTVERLTVVSSGYNWIELEWSPPAGDVDSFEYEVTVQKPGSRDRVHVTDKLSYKVGNLTPGTNYTLKVRVKFCNLTSDYTTVSGATSLEGLSEFEVHPSLDSPVLKIIWEHPLRDKGGVAFLLTVSENNETVIYNQNITQSPLSVSVNSFGKCFVVTLLVTGTPRRMPETKWISTPEKAPGPVVDLTYKRLTQDRTSLNISWSRPEVTNGVITEYRLSVTGTRGGNYLQTLTCQGNHCKLHCGNKHRTRKATVQGGSTSYFSGDEKHFSVLVRNLSLYENYDIRVTASTSQFTGPAVQLKTDDQLLDAVENFSGGAHNASCLALDWGYPTNGNSSDVLQFVLRYRKNSDTRLETTEPSYTRNTSETNLFLCGLDYFTNYTFSIVAVNKEGEGRVQEKYFQTAEFVPEAVTDLTVHPEVDIKKPRTLSITWKEPVNKHGIIRAYYVIISNSMGIVREEKVLPEHLPYHLQHHLWTENFTIQVFAETKAGNGSRATSLTQIPAGVLSPTQEEIKVEKSMKEHPATSAVAELPASLLCNHSYGSPVHTGLIVSTSSEQLSAERQTGPVPKVYKSWTEDKSLYYVPVELAHHCKESPGQPFKFLLGGDENCVKGGEFFNGFLTADTEYRLQAVMCTSAGCTYSPVSSPYRTDKMPEEGSSAAAVAAGVVVVLLLAVVGAAAGFFFFRRHRREKERERNDDEAQRCRMEDISRNRPVKLDEFAEHVDHLHRDSNLAFSEEYKTIKELSREYPTNAAELPACKLKNRYTNILPWDHTRVKLIPTDDEEGSDYINANYLPGYTHRREFIAAQGPLPATIDDFWRMVWENRVCIIVMLTQCVEKGKVKCEKYWPEENEAVFHGDLVVQVRSQSVLPDYIIRVIDVKMGNQTE